MSIVSPSIRKAALLVRSLDSESAALLLAQLSPQEARAVRHAARELGEINLEEQAELARELRRSDTQPLVDSGEVELRLETSAVAGQEMSPTRQAKSQAWDHASPFGWLEHGDLLPLATVLEREHLSTVAVVLSHLPPERAAELLSALPPERRAAALERLADLGESDRASLEVIEKSLADWIARQKRQRQLRADRVAAIRQMLEHSPAAARHAILTELARSDNRLATEINITQQHQQQEVAPLKRTVDAAPCAAQSYSSRMSLGRVASADREVSATDLEDSIPLATSTSGRSGSYQFSFEHLANLDTRDLGVVMQQTEPRTLVLALAGGSEEVMQHVIQQLPSHIARELRHRVNHLSQVRLSDFARAQEQISQTVAQLADSGQISARRRSVQSGS